MNFVHKLKALAETSISTVEFCVLLILGAITIYLWHRLGRARWRRRLDLWAHEVSARIVSFKMAHDFEGPNARLRDSDYHLVFKVVVEFRDGCTRTAWISYRSFWGIGPYQFSKAEFVDEYKCDDKYDSQGAARMDNQSAGRGHEEVK